MSKVYVVQEVMGRNFLPARKYGSLVPLLSPDTQVYLSATPAIRRLQRALKDFTDEDYLLLSGDPVLIGLAVGVATTNNRGKARLLKWDKAVGDYHPIDVDIYQKGESFD
jgi:hypothetical protein